MTFEVTRMPQNMQTYYQIKINLSNASISFSVGNLEYYFKTKNIIRFDSKRTFLRMH